MPWAVVSITGDHSQTGHAWTDVSFYKPAGLGWVVTQDDLGAAIIDQSSKTLPGKQVAFDAEITAIKEVLKWYQWQESGLRHLVIHSDTMSAIARSNHSGAGPGQRPAKNVCAILTALGREGRTAEIQWVKGAPAFPVTSTPTCLPAKRPKRPSGQSSSPWHTSSFGSQRNSGQPRMSGART
jgi:hypothetical protein